MSSAFGGAVRANPVREIGWGEVQVADNGVAREWLGAVQAFESFHWHVRSIDGHSLSEVSDAFDWARGMKDQPQAILARTVKGKGVSYLEERQSSFHGKPLPPEEEAKALEEIGASA